MVNFYIETYGCAANQSDSEMISGILKSAGIEKVNKLELASIVIVNTCIVKEPTEQKILRRLTEISKKYPQKKIIIAGCLPEAYSGILRGKFPKASLISTNRIGEILKIIEKIFLDEKIELIGKLRKEKIGLPKVNHSKVIDIIQINSGCLGNCSYCATKLAKGNLISFSEKKIIKEISEAKAQGFKEFWLTGQDISCYGFDLETNLNELLKEILEKVGGKYRIRLGMMNPRHLGSHLDELLATCEDPRVFKFFHIPVQSGSDKVLSEMSRGYKVSDFTEIIGKIRKKFPKATIGTDIIVGFPSETEEDFKKTLELVEKTKPDWINISRYWKRARTKAASLATIEVSEMMKRTKVLRELSTGITEENSRKWLEWEGEVLVDEPEKSRNFAYQEIKLNSKRAGRFLKVKINRIEGVKLFGKILN